MHACPHICGLGEGVQVDSLLALRVGGKLDCPCRCAGSIKWIHACLGARVPVLLASIVGANNAFVLLRHKHQAMVEVLDATDMAACIRDVDLVKAIRHANAEAQIKTVVCACACAVQTVGQDENLLLAVTLFHFILSTPHEHRVGELRGLQSSLAIPCHDAARSPLRAT